MEYRKYASKQLENQNSDRTNSFKANQGMSDTGYQASTGKQIDSQKGPDVDSKQPYSTTDEYTPAIAEYGSETSVHPASEFSETGNLGSYYTKDDNLNSDVYTADIQESSPATWFATTPDQMSKDTIDTSNNPSSYATMRQFRQFYASRGEKETLSEQGNQSAPVLFLGKDPSYPDALNTLMRPFFCAVCKSPLNSIKSSNIHYESRSHDRHITAWLKTTFTDKGLQAPKLQRFVTETANEAVSVYHCEVCNVELSSPQHALQHYNGKRHRVKASKISPIAGIGYFNVEGKWVETGKIIDQKTGKETTVILVETPTSSEPVALHCTAIPSKRSLDDESSELIKNKDPGEPPAKNPHLEVAATSSDNKKCTKEKKIVGNQSQQQEQSVITTPQTTPLKMITNEKSSTSSNQLSSQESHPKLQTPQEALNSLECKLCSVICTSRDQMLPHLKGARHSKRLKALGEPPFASISLSSPTSILDSLKTNDPSDISIYRTPSGSYYCKSCDALMSEVAFMKQHILSKKHLSAVKNTTPAPVSTLASKRE